MQTIWYFASIDGRAMRSFKCTISAAAPARSNASFVSSSVWSPYPEKIKTRGLFFISPIFEKRTICFGELLKRDVEERATTNSADSCMRDPLHPFFKFPFFPFSHGDDQAPLRVREELRFIRRSGTRDFGEVDSRAELRGDSGFRERNREAAAPDANCGSDEPIRDCVCQGVVHPCVLLYVDTRNVAIYGFRKPIIFGCAEF